MDSSHLRVPRCLRATSTVLTQATPWAQPYFKNILWEVLMEQTPSLSTFSVGKHDLLQALGDAQECGIMERQKSPTSEVHIWLNALESQS